MRRLDSLNWPRLGHGCYFSPHSTLWNLDKHLFRKHAHHGQRPHSPLRAHSTEPGRFPMGTKWAKHLLEQTSLCLRQECELLLFPGVHNVTHIKPEHFPYRLSQALEWNRKWRLPPWQWHQFSPQLNNISFLSFGSSSAKQGKDYYETQVRLCWLHFNNHLALHTNYSHSSKYDCVRSPEN